MLNLISFTDRGKNENIILNRVKSLQINGPLFSLSFLTFWLVKYCNYIFVLK